MHNNQRPQRSSATSDFEFLRKLGQGSFGVVYQVRRKTDRNIYVLKQINIAQMNPHLRKEALNEVKILSALDNCYIVKYYESFIEKNYLNIVMEFCEGGDLAKYIKSHPGRALTEAKIWKFLIQICIGLAYIHGKKILHRDIKSMNVFLSKDEDVRIGDLGVAKALAETGNFAHTMIGTPYYLSPEMCEEKPYNSKSDIWALGCVIYEMCTKRHPFEATNQAALILKIITGKFEPIPSTFSNELAGVVNECLCRDYKKRPSALAILGKPALQAKAKELNISIDSNISDEISQPTTSPLQIKQNSDQIKRQEERHSNLKAEQAKEKSPVSQKESVENRIIPPINNAFKIRGAPKVPSKEDLRSKSPIEQRILTPQRRSDPLNEILPAKSQVSNDKSPVSIHVKGRDKSPQMKAKVEKVQQKDISNINQVSKERNIKRIRKGAPQGLSRQAANAGRVVSKFPIQKKPLSSREDSEEPKKTSFEKDENQQNNVKEIERSKSPENKNLQKKNNKWLRQPLVLPKETIPNEELKEVVDFFENGKEPIPPIQEVSIEEKEENQIKEVELGEETIFEPVIQQVKWEVVEAIKEPTLRHNNDQGPMHNELDEIPVLHVGKNIPEFEVNIVNAEIETHEDEEDEYWDSNEDEEVYNNDKFEDDDNNEEEKKDNKGYESPEYEEDFETDEETNNTSEKKNSLNQGNAGNKEAIIKKIEKVQKEKEIIENLIKDRSSVCIKQIGEDAFNEIMSYLRTKIQFVENVNDLKEINDYLKKKVGTKVPEDQISCIMIKILFFEMRKNMLEEEIRDYKFELQ